MKVLRNIDRQCQAGVLSALLVTGACAGGESPESGVFGEWTTVTTIRGNEHDLTGWMDAVVLPTGAVVLADRMDQRIIWFSESGQMLRQVGRQGNGPGEFQMLNSLVATDSGTILAYDTQLKRLTEFSPVGELIRTSTLVNASFGWKLVAPVEEELLFVTETLPGPGLRSRGFGADSGRLVAIRLDAEGVRDLGAVPVRTRLAVGVGAGSMVISTPFDSGLFLAVCGAEVFAAFGDSEALSWIRRDGTDSPPTVRPHKRTRPEMTDGNLQAALDQRAEGQRRSDLSVRAAAQLDEYRDQLRRPFFDAAALDVDGTVWLRTGPTTWHQFAPSGERLGVVELPGESRIVSMSPGRVLVQRERDGGTDFVLMERPAPPNRRCGNRFGAVVTTAVDTRY